jgi:hypothetical protein
MISPTEQIIAYMEVYRRMIETAKVHYGPEVKQTANTK